MALSPVSKYVLGGTGGLACFLGAMGVKCDKHGRRGSSFFHCHGANHGPFPGHWTAYPPALLLSPII